MSSKSVFRWQQMREEWGSNPRLRMGVAVIAAIAIVYVCLSLADWRRSLHEEYQQRTLQVYKMAALAGRNEWVLRADRAKTVEKAVLAEIPSVASVGLAQAEIQASIRQILNAFGPKMVSEARPAVPLAGHPGIWRVPVAIRGPLSQAQFMEVLRRLEEGDRLVAIEESSISFVQGVPNVSLTAVAYYRIAERNLPRVANGAD